MGLIHATITLRNALDSLLQPYTGEARVDTDSLLLRISLPMSRSENH